MKITIIAIALIGATATASAFAQSAPATQQQQTYSTAQVASANVPAATAVTVSPGQWTAPYGQPVQEKTRAQVYHELVQAEQDGQLNYLNSTLYSH
ncbi:DUF4148 domain-containing protein [Trinickia mobilis]|uniref:DUF4148 domain-containing protein n=1 Tax=Trinickia mobilis TaxID=2816356 RepID=UPI001A8E7DBF|nr:DUF4148 domain-containing protein [Trinickia mobilis]